MKKKIRRYLSAKNFITNVFVPTLLAAIYFGGLGIVLNTYRIEGVNFVFVFKMLRLQIWILFFEVIILFLLILFERMKIKSFKLKFEWLSPRDLPLIILPITPIFQYLINNYEILAFHEILFIFGLFTLFIGLLAFVIPSLLSIIGNKHLLIAVGIAFTFTIICMPSLSQLCNWDLSGNFYLQLGLFLLVIGIILVARGENQKRLLYSLLLINFLVTTAYQTISQTPAIEVLTDNPSDNIGGYRLLSAVADKKPEIKPDVYFLVYESYVPNETMLAYGIDNHKQEDFLRENDFIIYPSVYSIGSRTLDSLSRVFNVSSKLSGEIRHGIAGDGIVQSIFQNLDYTTYGYVASSWIFRGYGSKYDFSYPETRDKDMDSDKLLISAILMGEFRSDLFFNENTNEKFTENKRFLLENDLSSPGFYYIHSGFPGHSQDSGQCRDNEIERYQENLEIANTDMQEDISLLLKTNPEAIIIIAGDHGPYLTKNCIGTYNEYDISEISRLDIQDRFATFLAIRWPTNGYEDYDEFVVLQDLYPVIFAYMYQDSSILQTKVEPDIVCTGLISSATVRNGIIIGGMNSGEALFQLDN